MVNIYLVMLHDKQLNVTQLNPLVEQILHYLAVYYMLMCHLE